MDDVDKAQHEIEAIVTSKMEALKPHRDAEPTGECLWCGEPLPDGRRWCDADCRDHWEAEFKARRNFPHSDR